MAALETSVHPLVCVLNKKVQFRLAMFNAAIFLQQSWMAWILELTCNCE